MAGPAVVGLGTAGLVGVAWEAVARAGAGSAVMGWGQAGWGSVSSGIADPARRAVLEEGSALVDWEEERGGAEEALVAAGEAAAGEAAAAGAATAAAAMAAGRN